MDEKKNRVRIWKALVALALPKIKQPNARIGYEKFLQYARELPDNDKVFMRRMLACLDMNKIVRQDYKLTYALWTKADREHNLIRQKNRRKFIKLGLVKRGDGTHVHHKDGNVRNNKMSNLQVVNGKLHKRAHAKSNHVANATCKLFVHKLRSALKVGRPKKASASGRPKSSTKARGPRRR